MDSESFWWCHRCLTRVECERVTFHEYHDGCGGSCEVLDEEPDVFAAARAWQAFRDFLNGVDDGEMEAWAARILFHREDAWQAGYDCAMHDVENA